jgi:hypothetical protein
VIQYLLRRLKVILRKSKKNTEWSISSISGVNIGKIKNSEASVTAEVQATPFTPRVASLSVIIKNEGKYDLSNIYIMATTSSGFSLNNSGELFGASWRMEKISRLIPTQTIRFKLTLRSNTNTEDGYLSIHLSPTTSEADPEAIHLKNPLKTRDLS